MLGENGIFLKSKNRLFRKMYDVSSNINFDDFTLTITGTVDDLSKFHELENNFPYGEVGFVKFNGEKQRIKFTLSENLKDISKLVRKEEAEVESPNHIDDEDGCFYNQNN